jgi:hypothetical protein
MQSDSVTILRSVDNPPRLLAKTNMVSPDGAWQSRKTQHPYHFGYDTVPVSSIAELSSLLTTLAGDPYRCIIRGHQGIHWDDAHPAVHRNKQTFDEVPRSWVLLDVEKYPVPDGLDLFRDERDIAAHFVAQLPPEFHGVSHHVQLSGSAGKNPSEFRAHFWFWLARPMGKAELERCLGKNTAGNCHNYIDPAVFRTVQVHITADPIFEGGEDPFAGRRSWFVEGQRNEVDLVSPSEDQAAPSTAVVEYSGKLAVGVDGFLAQMGDGPGLLGFYDAVVMSCASLFSSGPDVSGADRADWKEKVRAALQLAPRGPERSNTDLHRYASDEFLDDLLASFSRRERAKKLRLVGVADANPEHFAPELPPLVAKEKLQTGIRNWMSAAITRPKNAPASQLLVKGAAGLGKTTCAIDALAALPGLEVLNVEFYAPTRELGLELVEKLRGALGDRTPVDMIHGREAVVDGTPMCQRAPLATAMAKAGWDVTRYLCKGARDDGEDQPCPHRWECPYLAQFGLQSPQVRVLTHGHLRTRQRMRVPEPDLVVVDEAFYSQGLRSATFALKELFVPRGILPDDRALDETTRLIGEVLQSEAPLLTMLRTRGVTSEQLLELSGFIVPQTRFLNSFSTDTQAVEELQSTAPDTGQLIGRMLANLAVELGTGREHSNSVAARAGQVQLAWHLKLPLAEHNVLLLDASASPDVARVYLPQVEVLDLPVARLAHVTQVRDRSFSKTSLVAGVDAVCARPNSLSLLNLVQTVIDREARGDKRVLVVAPKKIAVRLRAPTGGAVEHFNNLRGKDGYKDFDRAVILSRELPPIAQIEDQARGLWFDSPSAVSTAAEWQMVRRSYRTRDGRAETVLVQGHPDPKVDMLLRAIREGEIEQAVDRLRLVHAGAAKRVLLLTSTPTGIVVDQLVPWSDLEPTRVEIALAETGFAPLTARECARLRPDLWPTPEAAKKALQRERGDNAFYNISIEGNVPYFVAEYRLPGMTSGKHARALVGGLDPQRTLATNVGEHQLVSLTQFKATETDYLAEAA